MPAHSITRDSDVIAIKRFGFNFSFVYICILDVMVSIFVIIILVFFSKPSVSLSYFLSLPLWERRGLNRE